MERPELVAAAYRAIPLGHEAQARHQPGGWLVTVSGLRLVHGGPGSNQLAAVGEAAGISADRLLTIAAERFRGGSYRIVLDAAAGRPLAAALAARGWQEADRFPAMVLGPIPAAPPPPPELTIRQVVDAGDLEHWFTAASPGARAPHDPPEVDYNRRFIHPSLTADPAIAFFTGWVGGRPVASSATYRADDVADIGAVAVWPEMRRRGYGQALTWAAVAHAAALGCAAAALHPTAMGYPVYARMGFVPACTFVVLEHGGGHTSPTVRGVFR